MPWNYRCWGVGAGSKGSYNNSHIQFEICEDNLKDESYYKEAFTLAVELCVYLCDMYGLDAADIVGHYEAHKLGYGSNHGDPQNWQSKFKDNMSKFRDRVYRLRRIGNYKTLRRGSKDKQVMELQNLLMKLGYSLPKYGADGIYGGETEKAVKNYQLDRYLRPDGIVGPITWRSLLLEY